MEATSEAATLTNTLLSSIRLQRHLGTRVFISTQEPTISPKLLDLCSITIVHRFTSPDWLQCLRLHLAALDADQDGTEQTSNSTAKENAKGTFNEIVKLRVGEALLFAPSAIIDVNPTTGKTERLGTKYLKIKIRGRVTEDGGQSVMAQGFKSKESATLSTTNPREFFGVKTSTVPAFGASDMDAVSFTNLPDRRKWIPLKGASIASPLPSFNTLAFAPTPPVPTTNTDVFRNRLTAMTRHDAEAAATHRTLMQIEKPKGDEGVVMEKAVAKKEKKGWRERRKQRASDQEASSEGAGIDRVLAKNGKPEWRQSGLAAELRGLDEDTEEVEDSGNATKKKARLTWRERAVATEGEDESEVLQSGPPAKNPLPRTKAQKAADKRARKLAAAAARDGEVESSTILEAERNEQAEAGWKAAKAAEKQAAKAAKRQRKAARRRELREANERDGTTGSGN